MRSPDEVIAVIGHRSIGKNERKTDKYDKNQPKVTENR